MSSAWIKVSASPRAFASMFARKDRYCWFLTVLKSFVCSQRWQFKLQAQRPAFLALRPKLGILVGDQNDRVRRSKICLERASDRGFIDRVIAGQRHDLESGLVEPGAKVCS